MRTTEEIEDEIAEAEDRLMCAQMAEASIECCGTAPQLYYARLRIQDCERELWALKDKIQNAERTQHGRRYCQ